MLILAIRLAEPPPPRPADGPAAKIGTDIISLLNDTATNKKRNETESTAQMKSLGFPSFHKIIRSFGNKTTQQVKTASTNSAYESNNEFPNIPNLSKLINPVEKLEKAQDLRIPYPRPLIKIDTTILENKTLIRFDYNELKEITSGFSNVFIHGPYGPTGKIGSGGFGDVYAGWHRQHGTLAVKKFRDLGTLFAEKPDFIAQTFNSEVKFLSQLRHENIVPILGYSLQMEASAFPSLCIVCQYIDGGSLEQKLAAKRLTEKQRLDIMLGTARGLKYIHNTELTDPNLEGEDNKIQFLHGDVKSANILLTRDCVPKVSSYVI